MCFQFSDELNYQYKGKGSTFGDVKLFRTPRIGSGAGRAALLGSGPQGLDFVPGGLFLVLIEFLIIPGWLVGWMVGCLVGYLFIGGETTNHILYWVEFLIILM